jgi:WD40 repeat protein
MTFRRAGALLLACSLLLVSPCLLFIPATSAQARRVRERLRGVLSTAKLSPEVRGNASIQYSPDGKYLFVQDSAGIMLFSRNPLQLVTYIDAPRSYPARFSADSQALILLTFDLFLTRWNVADGKQISAPNLVIPDGCLSAALSPAGDMLVCNTPDRQLAIYRLENGKKLFSASIHSFATGFGGVPTPFDSTTDFSAPFGFFLSSSVKQFANRGLFRLPTWFSPDGKFLIAGDDSNSLRVNMSTFTKENFASPLHKRMAAIAGLAQNDRALLLDRSKSEPPSVVSFATGQSIATFPVAADTAQLCTNSRFALFRKEADSTIQLGDLNSMKTVSIPDALAADVYGNEIAVLKRNGSVLFFKYGEFEAETGARLPLGSLPRLHAAAVDAGLTTFALSIDGTGETFDIATGKLLLDQQMFVGVQINDPKHPLFLTPRKFKTPQQILRGDIEARTAPPSWSAQPEAEILPGESAFLEYSFSSDLGRIMLIVRDGSGVAFSLRGLNPLSGAQLWRMKFTGEIPIPFCDPQGSRFVLGWRAKTSSARNAVKNNPAILDAFKHSKRMEQDSVFEVFDASTGKSLGGVFIQFGDGPVNFTSAFSVGDFVFLVKDNARVTVMSLRDGKVVVHAKGFQPTPSAQANLLALDEGYGRLGVYDLTNGTKIEQQQFADAIAYKHFSADGKKLLVLTQHQQLIVLDMSDVRTHPLQPIHEDKEPSDAPDDQPQ